MFDRISILIDLDGRELRVIDMKFRKLLNDGIEFDECLTLIVLQHVVFTMRDVFKISLIVETADRVEA